MLLHILTLLGFGLILFIFPFMWSRKWQPTLVFLPGESYGQRNLEGYSSWGHKESDAAKVIAHTHTQC